MHRKHDMNEHAGFEGATGASPGLSEADNLDPRLAAGPLPSEIRDPSAAAGRLEEVHKLDRTRSSGSAVLLRWVITIWAPFQVPQ